MKKQSKRLNWSVNCLWAVLAGALLTTGTAASAAEEGSAPRDAEPGKKDKSAGESVRKEIVIRSIEPGEEAGGGSAKEVAWLGVGVDETSEALAAQLGLNPGVGLVVTYVAKESPAAKAGFQKNDVLVELDQQPLVVPAQLRKLVRVRKEGDVVQVVLYRAGKKQTISATLGKTKAGFGLLGEEFDWQGDLENVKRQLRDLRIGDTVRERMKELQESLKDVPIDRHKVEVEVRRGMAEAHKGIREAMRHLTNLPEALGPMAEVLKELARSGVQLDEDASVVVRSTGRAARSLVKADESGTIVIVSNPNRRLTVHDAEGQLLFDGEVETAEQQEKVPRDLWEKVQPLIEKMNAEPEPPPAVLPPPPPPVPPTPAKAEMAPWPPMPPPRPLVAV